MSKFRDIVFCLSAVSVFCACQDSHDGPTVGVFSNVVTFEGNPEGRARFVYQEIDDSPEVTLEVNGTLNEEKVRPGTRLYMTYSLPDGAGYGESTGDVLLRGLRSIYTDTVSPLPYPAVADVRGIYLITLYRTGHFLNFTASMPELPGRRYRMYADESTLAADTVMLYMTTTVDDETPAFNSTQIGSIDISPVWDRASMKAVTVTVGNSNNPNRNQFTFTK